MIVPAQPGDRGRSGLGLVVRLVFGAVVGGVVGAIAAVNIVIFSGIDQGYEATPAEVFEENPIVGVVAAIAVLAGLGAGVVIARRGSPTRSP